MFSDNKKISERQLFRLLVFDLLGLGTLLVPTVLGRAAGRDGIFCIVLGVAAGLLYLYLLKGILRDMKGSFPEYLKEKLGNLGSRIVLVGYLIYFVLLAGYTAYLFTEIVLKNLLREESFWLVLALILLLVFYGMWEGLEGRTRVYEILFWVLLIPLFLMLFSALNEIETDYWAPVFTAKPSGMFSGSYDVFFPMSFLFFLLFLGNAVEKKEVLFSVGRKAVLFTGSIYAVLYLILLGIFGAAALGTMEFPAVTLMSTVKISGGFLKRTDAFMFGIWFFTLFALLSSNVFFGAEVLRALAGKGVENSLKKSKKRERISALVVLPAVFVVAELFYRSEMVCKDYEVFLRYVGTPFLVLVPVLLVICRFFGKRSEDGSSENDKAKPGSRPQKKEGSEVGRRNMTQAREKAGRKKAVQERKKTRRRSMEQERGEAGQRKKRTLGRKLLWCTGLFLMTGSLLCGCSTAELEERNFPIELAVKDTDSFVEAWLNAGKAGNRVLDYNHLKVLILGRDFLEDEDEAREFLDFLEKKESVPRNTYVVAAENPEEIIKLTGGKDESIGNYLEQLFENVSEAKKKMYPTLGMLYQEKENRLETLFIPIVAEKSGKPVVEEYYVWKRGEAAGIADSETVLLSFFTQNAMDAYTVVLGDGAVRLTSAHNEIHFSEEDGKKVVVEVHCDGEILYESSAENADAAQTARTDGTEILQQSDVPGQESVKDTTQKLEQELEYYMNVCAAAALEQKLDVTNSYRKLGGYMRDWYFEYLPDGAGYEEDVNIVYKVKITWVNL